MARCCATRASGLGVVLLHLQLSANGRVGCDRSSGAVGQIEDRCSRRQPTPADASLAVHLKHSNVPSFSAMAERQLTHRLAHKRERAS